MKEGWIPMWKTVRKKSVETVATVFLASASVGYAGCGVDFRSPIVFEKPTPTAAPTPTPEPTLTPTPLLIPTPEPTSTKIPTPTPTATPKPTATIIPTAPRPTETTIPPPTPTKPPEPTPTKTAVPTKTPRPTPTPRPPSTPRPAPSPTPLATPAPPEAQKTYVKPGGKLLDSVQDVYNPSSAAAPKKRSFNLEFEVESSKGSITNEKESVNKRISQILPDGSEEGISEGAVFDVPSLRVVSLRIIVDIPPGAYPGCFKNIIFSLKTREPGTNRGEIERVILAKEVCVQETLTTLFTGLYYDEGTKRVVGDMLLFNSAGVGQMAELKFANCAFKIAEKEAERITEEGLLERLDLNTSNAFPANSQRKYKVILTPVVDKKGKKPSPPFGCTVTPKREFGKNIPEPKPK